MEVMSVNEFVGWLVTHGHEDVRALSEIRIESTYHGKRRAYEQVPAVMSSDASLFGGDIERGPYWMRVAP